MKEPVIHYEDNVDLTPDDFTDPAKTLVVYTPAVPEDPFGALLFPGEWFRGDEACPCIG